MKKTTLQYTFLAMGFALAVSACKKDDNAAPVIPPSDGSKLTLNGGPGGASAVNSVYVDFSADRQDSVKRESWDLGFYGGDDYRVIINHTTGATAIQINKTDLTQVTASDTIGKTSLLTLGTGDGAFSAIDPVDTSKTTYLNGTVIKAVSATDADNKVYIINRGTAGGVAKKDLEKVRIIRKSSGYTLQYAKLGETTFKTIDIAKNADYNFNYISFENGAVTVEPAKAKWDIQWTLSTYKATATIPYTFSDFVLINFVGGTQAAEIMTSTVSYENFAAANIAAVKFSSNRDVIGGNWRVTQSSTETVGVRTNRFYVIKDVAGNVYKLRFISFTSNDGGVRGYPVIEYKLVK